MTGNRVDLVLDRDGASSRPPLPPATAISNRSRCPIPKARRRDTKILRADVLDLQMKPGGKDLERVNTQAPGTLEFLPNQIARHRRILKADRMMINYGEKNEIQSFHATSCPRRPPPKHIRPKRSAERRTQDLATSFTSSKIIDATFDDKGQLKFMKQTEDFHYTEGDRKAQADQRDAAERHQRDGSGPECAHFGRFRLNRGRPYPDAADRPAISTPRAMFPPRGCPKRTRANRPCSIKTSLRWARRTA